MPSQSAALPGSHRASHARNPDLCPRLVDHLNGECACPPFPLVLPSWLAQILVSWDAGYQLMLPDSLDLPLWKPYQLYSKVDLVYSPHETGHVRAWGKAQTVLNCIELAVQAIVFLRVALFGRRDATAFFLCSLVIACTMAKTVLYFVLEACNDWQSVGPAAQEWSDFVLLYLIPNGAWIVVPFFCCVSLGKQFCSAVEAKEHKD
jgi:hypothetical protein